MISLDYISNQNIWLKFADCYPHAPGCVHTYTALPPRVNFQYPQMLYRLPFSFMIQYVTTFLTRHIAPRDKAGVPLPDSSDQPLPGFGWLVRTRRERAECSPFLGGHRPDRPLVPLLLPAWILGTAGRTSAASVSPVPVIDGWKHRCLPLRGRWTSVVPYPRLGQGRRGI